jgi:hypothetical protein
MTEKKKGLIKKILKPVTKKIVTIEPDERQEEIKRAKQWLDTPAEPDERQQEIKRVKKFFGKE